MTNPVASFAITRRTLVLDAERQGKTDTTGASSVAARATHFDASPPCLAGRTADAPHVEFAARLGLPEAALRVALHRLRTRFRQLLRDEIAHTVARPEDIDAELRHLIAAVATP